MSTSSSNPPAESWRPPWAFLLALLLLLGFELGLRAALPVEEYPTRQNMREGAALRHVLDHYGAAEVAFVGASVTRRGVHVPQIREACELELGRKVMVANYGHAGLKAELGEDVFHVLLREDPPPRLLLYGMTPHQIRREREDDLKTSWVWTLPDFRREYGERGLEAFDELPQVIRNEVRRHYRTLQVRYAREEIYDRIVHGTPFMPSCMMGEQHHQGGAANMSIARRDPAAYAKDLRLLEVKINDCTEDGRFQFSPARIECLRTIQEQCDQHGVRVIFFEIPLPKIHTDLFPPGTQRDFQRHMQTLQEEAGLTFIPFSSLGIRVTDADFADQSHLNLKGCTKMSYALIERVIRPELRRLEGR